MTRRKTDGECIAGTNRPKLAGDIDRIIRRRMAEAWDAGWFHKTAGTALDDNPYRGKKDKA